MHVHPAKIDPIGCATLINHNITMQRSMFVVKRDGKKESVSFDKVLKRIQKSARGLEVHRSEEHTCELQSR